MNRFHNVMSVFDETERSNWDSALMSACIAVDGTSKVLHPSMIGHAKRFKQCIRDYYWLIEPMMGVGLNLVDTRFTNVTCIRSCPSPDFADLVYHIIRCNHAHGEEVPVEFHITGSRNAFFSEWELGPNSVRMPDKVIWALTAVAIFSRVNGCFHGKGKGWRISWGAEIFPIDEWWGREVEIKQLATGWNTRRVEIKELSRLNKAGPATAGIAYVHSIAPPPTCCR